MVRADIIELTTGGRVDGKIVQSDEPGKSTVVIDLAAGGQITIPRSQIASFSPVTATSAEYKKRARTSPDTVEAHWKIAEWCRENRLNAEYKAHMERIVELDPNHAEARAALGFRRKDGEWMNRDDVMGSRGLVLYEGRYVTPQHVELIEQQKKTRATQADWTGRIEQLRKWVSGRRQDKAAQAHAELLAINDPAAAEAVVAVLRRERNPELKRLWIEVASHLNHRATLDALVQLSLHDEDEEIRQQCLEYLVDSGRTGLATPYIRALNDKDNEIINRAAAALGKIGDRSAIGPLIDALITKHRVKVGDGNPDQHAYTFSKEGSAFSFGGGGPRIETQAVRNRSVLDALVTMSGGASFDFDQDRWRGWLAAQAKATAVDLRRDQ